MSKPFHPHRIAHISPEGRVERLTEICGQGATLGLLLIQCVRTSPTVTPEDVAFYSPLIAKDLTENGPMTVRALSEKTSLKPEVIRAVIKARSGAFTRIGHRYMPKASVDGVFDALSNGVELRTAELANQFGCSTNQMLGILRTLRNQGKLGVRNAANGTVYSLAS